MVIIFLLFLQFSLPLCYERRNQTKNKKKKKRALFGLFLCQYLFNQGEVPRDELLIAALVNVLDEYDFVIIDTPPNLGTQTLNALMASDHVVVMFETAKYAYNAIDRFLETINSVRKYGNEELNILGILATLSDARRSDNKELLELVQEEYGDLIFNTVIPRRAAIGRIPVYGLYDNPELKAATEHHAKFIEEVLTRVN